jgi:hypothetical protein
VLDCPVKPDNDDFIVFACQVNNQRIPRSSAAEEFIEKQTFYHFSDFQ